MVGPILGVRSCFALGRDEGRNPDEDSRVRVVCVTMGGVVRYTPERQAECLVRGG